VLGFAESRELGLESPDLLVERERARVQRALECGAQLVGDLQLEEIRSRIID
jgi:hypothetical protein